jgi:hypothetical protein
MRAAEGRRSRWLIYGVFFVALLWPRAMLHAQTGADQALGACRRETATRLKIAEKDVVAQPGGAQEQPEGGQLFTWFATNGAKGECRYENGRVASWDITRKARRFEAESACTAAVAKLYRMRPEDVDIIDIEKRSQTASILSWMTYQGHTGKCRATQSRIDSIEKD